MTLSAALVWMVLGATGTGVSAQPPCSLCPDGGNVTFPDRIVPQLGIAGKQNPTCQDAAEYAPSEISTDGCRVLQAQAPFCGCSGTSRPSASNACTFCANGESPENGNMETPFGDTCDELNEYVGYLTVDECQTERGDTLLRNAFLCGCASAETSCGICPDGSIDVGFPDRVIPFFNLNAGQANPTCQQVAAAAAVAAPETIDCDLVKAQAGYCGCASTINPKGKCTFCPNGAEPSNMKLVTPSSDTCEDLFHYSGFLDEDDCASKRFSSIQGLGFVCGCPEVEPACTLCKDGSDPPNLDQQASPDGQTCGQLKQVVEALTTEACVDQETINQVSATRCGCPEEDFPTCRFQQNPHLCTQELLHTVEEECECASFCDGEFFTCHDFPGGLLSPQLCAGVGVSGCNRANARSTTTTDTQSGATVSHEVVYVYVALFATVTMGLAV